MTTKLATNKDIQVLIDLAADQDWMVNYTSNNHIRFENPDGEVYFCGSTHSDWRSIKNARSALKNMGLCLTPPPKVRTGSTYRDTTEYFEAPNAYECSLCATSCSTAAALLNHLQNSHNRTACPSCFRIIVVDRLDDHENVCRGRITSELSRQLAEALS